MAGMSHGQELRNAHSTKFLNYGHLGTLTYHEEDETWKTLRNVGPHVASARHANQEVEEGCSTFPLRYLSSKVVYDGLVGPRHKIESVLNDSDSEDIHESCSGPTATTDPSVKTVDSFGGRDEFFQKDASTLGEKHLPNLPELLAFGSAVSAVINGIRSELVYISVVASVTGSNGQCVRLAKVGKQATGGLDFDAGDGLLQIPYISSEDEAYWTSDGGSIQQVCFAAATGHASTWMAARLRSFTTIFHPVSHRKPVPPRYGSSRFPFQALPSSVLDPNPIATIPISRTGGHPHADVRFHPQEHSKLALIDEHGIWSVWLVDDEGEESLRSRFQVTLISCGKVWTWDYEKRLRESLPHHDGWHRVSWFVGNNVPDELFICNRRTAAVYNASGDLLGLIGLHLGHSRENQLILDVQWSRLFPGYCFVLTSTRLFWLYFMDAQLGNSGQDHAIPRVLLAWQHFRDRGDRTLRLILLETGLTTVVLLVSRLMDLVLVFRVGLVNDDKALPLSLADPTPILLPQHPFHFTSRRLPSSMLFHAIQSSHETKIFDEAEKPHLFKIFSLYEDFSIVEHLYLSIEHGFVPRAGPLLSSVLLLPASRSLRRSRSQSPNVGELGDFILPDEWVEQEGSLIGRRCHRHQWDAKREKPYARTRPIPNWQDVYAYLADQSKNTAINSTNKMDAFLRRVSDHLNQPGTPGITLLSELLACRLHITDVDADSEQWESLISTFTSQQGRDKNLERLPTVPLERQPTSALTSIYDALVAIHLTPLSPQAPDRARVNKERLARRVTADLLLASTAIYPLPTIPPDAVNIYTVPSRSTSQPTFQSSSDTQNRSRPASFPATATNSTTTTPTTEEMDPVFTRLGRYTNISPPFVVPSISTNPALSSILRHLPSSPHTNPSTYNYRATERALAAEQEEELAIAAGKADPRARKKAEKAMAVRLRREEARRRKVEEVANSQQGVPTVVSGWAGPGTDTDTVIGMSGLRVNDMREVQSSQTMGPSAHGFAGSSQAHGGGQGQGTAISATQPERGIFATRPGAGGVGGGIGRKKKRAAGF